MKNIVILFLSLCIVFISYPSFAQRTIGKSMGVGSSSNANGSCIRADSIRTLPNDTNENALFDAPTNGRLTLDVGTYLFDGILLITNMSVTNGNGSIDILGAGTATTDAWLYRSSGLDSTTPGTTINNSGSFNVTQQTAAAPVGATIGAALALEIRGTMEISVAGTLIPSIAQTTAAAASVNIGSYMCFRRISGSTSTTNIGLWD